MNFKIIGECPWIRSDEAVCAASFANVRDALEQFAVPWFRRMENERYVRWLLLRKKLTGKLSVYDEEWLHMLDHRGDCAARIREHMDQLGLPKSLIRANPEKQEI